MRMQREGCQSVDALRVLISTSRILAESASHALPSRLQSFHGQLSLVLMCYHVLANDIFGICAIISTAALSRTGRGVSRSFTCSLNLRATLMGRPFSERLLFVCELWAIWTFEVRWTVNLHPHLVPLRRSAPCRMR